MGDRQVFIGNLCNVSNETLRSYCETYGPLTELSLNRDKENNIYHCFAFVTFQHSRCVCQFLASRPHFLNGEEMFVKRALPRLTSSIPERLIVTNRLILEDFHKQDKHSLRTYFQKFGQIKNFDYDQGFIDFDDYDDVDRILLARPHYIRDREISVTKFIPSDHQDDSLRLNHHRSQVDHHYRSTTNEDYKQQPARNLTISSDSIQFSRAKKRQRNSSRTRLIDTEEDIDMNRPNGDRIDCHYLNSRYEHLEEKFDEYKQSKEIELCTVRMDLERTKRQLADITQEKLDLLIKNQQLLHGDLIGRLFPDEKSTSTQTAQDFIRLTPNKLAKKRKLITTSSSADREYDYYS